jgi:hypothetical protein
MAVVLGSSSGTGTRREAEEHVARCSDCWAVLALLHELSTGEPPPGGERMAALFGCGPVQDEMYLFADLTAVEIAARHPEAARHLSWCLACRGRLAEVILVERASARGELGPPVLAPVRPGWRNAGAQLGEIVREAVGRLAVEVRRTAAVFTVVPEGFVMSALAPAGALRSSTPEPPTAADRPAGRQVRFTLADDLSAELTLEPEGGERFGMVARLSASGTPRLSLHLREVQPEGATLVARYTATSSVPVVMRGLAPGRYLLEIEDKQTARRFQLRFDVEAAG